MAVYRETGIVPVATRGPDGLIESWLWGLRFVRRLLGGRWELWRCQAPAGLGIFADVWIRVSGGAFAGGWMGGWYGFQFLAAEEWPK